MPIPIPVADLKPPTSLAERWDVAILLTTPGCEARACAAALGLCWLRFRRRHPYSGNALAYGGTVIDGLLAEGYRMGEISTAAAAAVEVITDGLVNVEGAEDFSSPPAAPAGSASGGASMPTST